MNAPLEYEAYAVIAEFLDALNSMNHATLESSYGVSATLFTEISECMHDYFGKWPDARLAPLDIAFSGKKNGRPYIDIFPTNQSGVWKAECILWVEGKVQEPILHVQLIETDGRLRLRYEYIGS